MRIKRLSEGIRTARISEPLNESDMDSYVYKTQLSGKPNDKQSYVEIVSPPAAIKNGGFINSIRTSRMGTRYKKY